MASQLFNTAAMLTDLHFGEKGNSKTHNQDILDYIDWFIAESKKRNADTCIFLGDYHHHRNTINVSTLNYSIEGIKRLNDAFDQVFFISGNHDNYYRENRDINSLPVGNLLSRTKVISEPFKHGEITILPWLVNDEWKNLQKDKSRYMFGHFELPSFKMNALVEMPDHGGLNRTHLKNQEYVFSGHFHKRQNQGNVHYIGNPFGHNYSDAWDTDRGAAFLNYGGTPEYVNYENGPRYITAELSELIKEGAAEKYLLPKTYAKINVDVDISYEEANYIRETFLETFNIRELKLIPQKKNEEQQTTGDIKFESVDQIVTESINKLETETYSKATLLKIYNSLD